jgi:FlaA1/EpsC-like NDP-sugar epimerase
LIVVDHINHFTAPSLSRLLLDAGLTIREIDSKAHRGAHVAVCVKQQIVGTSEKQSATREVDATLDELSRIARFWIDVRARIRQFEQSTQSEPAIAIYGAGFYGAFIASCLEHPERVACFLDQNPHLQGKALNGIPILAPADLSEGVTSLFVGLNPASAEAIFRDITSLRSRSLRTFFL